MEPNHTSFRPSAEGASPQRHETTAQRREKVIRLLTDPATASLSDREIARRVGVSSRTPGNIRRRLAAEAKEAQRKQEKRKAAREKVKARKAPPTPGDDRYLVLRTDTGVPLADSRHVADYFGKRHSDLLEAIRELHCSEQFRETEFSAIYINDLDGKNYTSHVLMTRDGFMLLVMDSPAQSLAV